MCDKYVSCFDSSKLDEFPVFLEKALLAFSRHHAEAVAFEASKSFVLPSAFFERDAASLVDLDGSIANLIALRQDEARVGRFNEVRCRRLFASDPEFGPLLDLAVHGAVVEVDPLFVPISDPDKPRLSHSKLHNCFAKHLHKLWELGRGVALSVSQLSKEQLVGVHVSPKHWTAKVDAEDGRFLVDLSNRSVGSVINSEHGFEKAKSRYGVLHLPTIIDILTGWRAFINQNHVVLGQCRCFKDDVSAAFCQFNFSPSSSKLLAVMWGHIIFFFIVGLFGWAGAPIVFGLLSRALERLLRRTIVFACFFLYVDDVIGLVLIESAERAQQGVHECIEDMFGSGSLEKSKSKAPSSVQVIIGWQVDLIAESIRPSDRGIQKLIVAFFSFDCSERVSLHLCQVLASLAQRYSLCLRGMKLFVQPFHKMIAAFKNNSLIRRKLTSAARFCVVMWRAVGLLLFLNPDAFNVHVWSLLPSLSQFFDIVTSDAGPRGLGVSILDPVSFKLLGYSSFVFPFDASDPSYQCCREYMGYLFSLLVLCVFHGKMERGRRILWRTDNTAAQKWVQCNMSSSTSAQVSLMAVTVLTLRLKLEDTTAEHIPGHTMGYVDDLSRGYETFLDESLYINIKDNSHILELFQLCDPTVSRDLSDHLVVFENVHRVLDSFLSDVGV